MKFLGFEAQDFTVAADKYYAYDYDYFNMKTHSHRNAEIMYAESGVSEVQILSASGTMEKLLIKKGQFVVISSKTPHRLLVKKNTHCKILNLELIADHETLNKYLAIISIYHYMKKIITAHSTIFMLNE